MYFGDLHEEHAVPKPRKRGSRCSIALSILLAFVIICICHQLLEPLDYTSIQNSRSLQPNPHDRHLHKAVAVVQYDNPDRISLLDCYLKRDLIANNGPLSSVIFFAHPDISPSASHALDNLIASSPHYIRFNITSTIPSPNIPTLLPLIAERSTLYITIPSSTVYIRPHALAHLITSKLSHPAQPLTIANSITAHRQPPSSPRRTAGSLTPTRGTISADAESATSRTAPASSAQGSLSLLLSQLTAKAHLAAPPDRHHGTDPKEDRGHDARLHAAFMHSLTLGRMDQWVRRSRRIAPHVDATSAHSLANWMWEGSVVAVWGADVLDRVTQGSAREGEVWMDGMDVVAVWDGVGVGGEGTELLERWAGYARAMVCPLISKEEEGVELKR